MAPVQLFADENMPRTIVVQLRAWGHDVLYASEVKPGAADRDWLAHAEADGRVILTSDKDFGDLIFRDRLNSHGVVLLRLHELTITERLARLEQAWPVVAANPLGKFVVISPRKIRVRDLGTKAEFWISGDSGEIVW